MIVLLMYENDRHTLKRNLARGRCGLPGMPNRNFFQKKGTECEADKEKEPFEKEMKVLKTDIHGHRKQIEETKERVENADKQLLTIDVTATGMKKKYDQIMFLLKEDILDAEEEVSFHYSYISI
ncbi:hypothetical protein LSTR_LSTR009225 [Laodelphax striatellus]|uniref:Uncharacterized protein n=1 Tax=Laodelphax striatellus TaxID=195883 RepID=A0A482XDS5_LAOST|nr:hypothetical protein LSTR_LSTR009225 [Laodelphax striatellus]